jgi:hypothetical protein
VCSSHTAGTYLHQKSATVIKQKLIIHNFAAHNSSLAISKIVVCMKIQHSLRSIPLVCAMILLVMPASALSASGQVSGQNKSQTNPTSTLMPPIFQSNYPSTAKSFAFVSDFESLTLEGWQSIQGTNPVVVASRNYSGEPSLKSSAASGNQIDFANSNFIPGLSGVSMQVAIYAPHGTSGFFGLGSNSTNFVAAVGVRGGKVLAGRDLTHLKEIEAVPKNTAFPSGWVYIIADLAGSGKSWTMQVFVDETQDSAFQVLVPNAGSYAGAMIETTSGTVYYTNIIATTTTLAKYVPGYHPMQGYGGSIEEPKNCCGPDYKPLLPAFYNLTAVMTINNFSVPESEVLSFQINAQNKTSATEPTCSGFFQIGMFLDPETQYVDPWYVSDGHCAPFSFPQGGTLHIDKNEKIILSIVFNKNSQSILFKEVFVNIHKTLSQSVPYSGGPFYSLFTQMEYQPSSSYPIGDYKISGSIFGVQITENSGVREYLPASYLLPFNIDTPTTWDVHYYVNSTAGYDELST